MDVNKHLANIKNIQNPLAIQFERNKKVDLLKSDISNCKKDIKRCREELKYHSNKLKEYELNLKNIPIV